MIVRPLDPALDERLFADGDFHAPHLIDVEVLHSLRRLVQREELADHVAEEAREAFGALSIVRYPHTELLDRMWELRHNLTPYDAAFVALAEVLDVPLVTKDGRLARSAGHGATIELY